MTYTFVFAAALAVFASAGVSTASAHEAGHNHGWHLGHYKEERAQHVIRFDARHEGVVAGVVTAVNGSTITIDPVGKKSSTTVTATASTTYKMHGSATTSSAVKVGSRVLVSGTTTASTDTGDTISASLIRIFEKGWGHVRIWLSLH